MECLDEGTALGTDEQGCGAEEGTTESTVYPSTRREKPNSEGDGNGEAENPESDLWSRLKEKVEKENRVDQVDQEQGESRVTPAPIEWPCGGLLQTFYGTFAPPALRGAALSCVWTLDPQDSRPLRLDLQQLLLGPGDKLTVYNKEDGKGELLKKVSLIQIREKYPALNDARYCV